MEACSGWRAAASLADSASSRRRRRSELRRGDLVGDPCSALVAIVSGRRDPPEHPLEVADYVDPLDGRLSELVRFIVLHAPRVRCALDTQLRRELACWQRMRLAYETRIPVDYRSVLKPDGSKHALAVHELGDS